jgi:hypothetical protein
MAVPHLCHSRHRLSYRIPLVRSKLCRLLELLEPERQSVPVGAILTPPRQLDLLPDDPFQAEFEKRTIMDFEQPVRDVDAEIGVNADQVIWWILVSGNPFETIGCLNSLSASVTMWAASTSRGSGRWEIASHPRRARFRDRFPPL